MVLAKGVARPLEPSLSWDWAKALLPSLPAPSVPQALLWILLFSPSPFFFLLVTLSSPGPFCLGFRPSPFLSLASSLSSAYLCLPRPPSLSSLLPALASLQRRSADCLALGALPQKLQTLGPFPGASRGLITASQASQASHYQHHGPPSLWTHPQAPTGTALASILELSGMKSIRMSSVVGPRRGPTCIPYQSLLPSCLHSSLKCDHFRCRRVISAFQDPVGKKS